MGVGVRRSIILSKPLKRWLEAEAARLGIGEAERFGASSINTASDGKSAVHYLKSSPSPGDPNTRKRRFGWCQSTTTEIRFHRNQVHSKPVTVRCGEDMFELSADFMVFVLNASGNGFAGFVRVVFLRERGRAVRKCA